MTQSVRPPAVAGMFYPADVAELRDTIAKYLEKATPAPLTNVRAVIVPHAGYVYSGVVAAFAYRLLADQPTRPKRIYLLGPAHRAWFAGVALVNFAAFRTPLGDMPVDVEQTQKMAVSGSLFAPLNSPHAPEHCLEVQVPFLQMIYPPIPIVPILFGDVNPKSVGQRLNQVLEPDDLIIVSSDLSHFHDNEVAHTIDRQFLDALLAEDEEGVANGEACGQAPALALMVIARQQGWRPHLLDYRTSGDITGDRRRVVGYASVAYVEEA